jgi:hypothetical protein
VRDLGQMAVSSYYRKNRRRRESTPLRELWHRRRG